MWNASTGARVKRSAASLSEAKDLSVLNHVAPIPFKNCKSAHAIHVDLANATSSWKLWHQVSCLSTLFSYPVSHTLTSHSPSTNESEAKNSSQDAFRPERIEAWQEFRALHASLSQEDQSSPCWGLSFPLPANARDLWGWQMNALNRLHYLGESKVPPTILPHSKQGLNKAPS